MQATLEHGEDWDRFLRGTPEGHFQQSSAWARVKRAEGWTAVRRVVGGSQTPEAGFQLLYKRSRLGRIGYVSKGPVTAKAAPPDAALRCLRLMIQTADELGIRAIVTQPPDGSALTRTDLVRLGFFPHPLPSIIDATAIVPLHEGPEAVLAAMESNSRRKWRAATKRGVTFRWGKRTDLRAFFDLMCVSARRQGSSPNPPRLALLEELWDALSPEVSLAIAEHEGVMNAAALLVGFGSRLSVWKVGWSGTNPELFGSCLVNVEALLWGARNRYKVGDFVAIDPTIAEALLAGRPLSERQNHSKDKFHLELGAHPQKLPAAQLRVVNPLLRQTLSLALSFPVLRQRLLARVGG